MTFRELEREALGLSPAERALLAELISRSLVGQDLQQLSLATPQAGAIEANRLALEARIEGVFAEASEGDAELWTAEHWDRLLQEELPEFEPIELDLLALPPANRA